MKKILFPTDFSQTANNAFVYALQFAASMGAEIITLHVYELPQVDFDYIQAPVYLLDVYEVTELGNFENYKHHIPVLRDIAEQHGLGHITISNVLESGNLIDSIHRISEQEAIDYIIMGTKGAQGLASTFLGSVTEKVMHHSKSVVLAIPEGCAYEQASHILFTTKFKPEDRPLLDKVIALATVFQSRVTCLYVENDDHTDQRVAENWKQGIAYDKIDFHITRTEDVEGEILNFITAHQINMLAMPKHHKGFFEGLFHTSLTKKLAFHLKIPIMALHD
jgi:nucleotide-binding universal stress UspA family protein